MESPNAAKLRLLCDFLRFDATDPRGFGKADGLGNIQLAVVSYLENHFSPVVMAADILDDIDAETVKA